MPRPELRKTADGTRLTADARLGTGNQGEVWRATDGGVSVAVKLYHRHTASPEQKAALERLVAEEPPDPHFLWPMAMVEDTRSGTYGYVMALREPNFRKFEDFMARRFTPSMRVLLTAGTRLAAGFLRLHSKGLCYRDISFGNVFFDPETGDVRICDNDNVDIEGAEIGGVLGTPRFMAPEVVRREKPPSANTDRYSLAVLLFFLLYSSHPLDGRREARIRCLDLPAWERLYGFDPLYIWDPDDKSNRPVPGIHDNPIEFHDMYPKALADLFEQSFTEGLRYPNKRVRESEWRNALAGAIDSIWLCGCSAENFHEPAAAASSGSKRCWRCKKTLVLPPRIRIGDRIVLLNPTTRLFGYHIGGSHDDDNAIAKVVPNPGIPDLFGLKNLGSEAWTLTKPDGSTAEVPPGRSAPILNGNRILFGREAGEIQA